MNKVVLVGNLGADAELKVVGNGSAVLSFRLATSERWTTKDGEKKERTDWHRVSLWGPRAEKLAPHLKKGTSLVVEGSVRYSEYEKDGEKRYATDIVANNVEFVGKKQEAAASAATAEDDDFSID